MGYGVHYFGTGDSEDIEYFNSLKEYLIRETIENGVEYKTYSNDYKIYNNWYGDMQIYLKVKEENGQKKVVRCDSHATGFCQWHLFFSGARVEGYESVYYMFAGAEEESLPIIVDFINDDILPSTKLGNSVVAQICAFPASAVRVFSKKDLESQELNTMENGLYGSKLASKVMFLKGRIVGQAPTKIELLGNKYEDTYYSILVETNLGYLEVIFSSEMCSEEEQEKLVKDNYILCDVYLSADISEEYHKSTGIILNEKNNLIVLRDCLREYNPRVLAILSDSVEYSSDVSNKHLKGKEAVISYLKEVSDSRKDPYVVHKAIIVNSSHELKYKENKLCLILENTLDEQYESIVFIELDKDGLVKKIIITDDSRYNFHIENFEGISLVVDYNAKKEIVVKTLKEKNISVEKILNILRHNVLFDECYNYINNNEKINARYLNKLIKKYC